MERDALQQRVFPKLEQLCLKDGFHFQAIDLRWGVSTEAGLDHRTMRICFEELRRSQDVSPEPNFLILLGNRYGWRPLPEEISADEFRSLEAAAGHVEDANQEHLLKALNRWYRRDDNSLTPVYILQPRRKSKSDDLDDTDYTQAEVWREAEQAIWRIINRAFPASGLKDRFSTVALANERLTSIVRFQASATEQEIWRGALSVADASQHVLAFFRQIEFPTQVPDVRRIKDFFDLASGEIDSVAQAAQQDLKSEIKKRLGSNAVELPTARLLLKTNPSGVPTAAVSADHIDELCNEVESRLTTIIGRQIKQYWESTDASELSVASADEQRTAREFEIEREEHYRFGQERGSKETFVGRQDQLDAISAYLQGDSAWPLVIHGASGCGKSSLLAHVGLLRSDSSGESLLMRFIGATPTSIDLRSLLRGICHDLRRVRPLDHILPTDVESLCQELRQHMQGATVEQPLVLLLDALDQLSDADDARQLNWLPQSPLPANVRLVVSCVSDKCSDGPAGEPYEVLRRRGLPAESFVVVNSLSEADAILLLFDRWLPLSDRTVTVPQRQLIEQRLTHTSCREAFYLKVMFEEVRLWSSWESPTALGADTFELIGILLTHLSACTAHGETVRHALCRLASARRGLTEHEILQMLYEDESYLRWFREQFPYHDLPADADRIPVAIWSRLRFDLAAFITERVSAGGVVQAFYHRQVAEAVTARWLTGAQGSWGHEQLGDYFSRLCKATQFNPHDYRQAYSLRCLDELLWQLVRAGRWRALFTALQEHYFVRDAWIRNSSEVLSVYYEMEAHSPYRLVDAYRSIIERPEGMMPNYLFQAANLLESSGHYEEVVPILNELVRFYLTKGRIVNVAHAEAGLAIALYHCGEYAQALDHCLALERVSRRSDYRYGLQAALACRAVMAYDVGDVATARTLEREVEVAVAECGDEFGLQSCLMRQATIHHRCDEQQDAIERLSDAKGILPFHTPRRRRFVILSNLATALRLAGRSAEAASFDREAVGLFAEVSGEIGRSCSSVDGGWWLERSRGIESLSWDFEMQRIAEQRGLVLFVKYLKNALKSDVRVGPIRSSYWEHVLRGDEEHEDAFRILTDVSWLLRVRQPHEALERVERSRVGDARLINARGVCLLQLGEPQRAVELFREIALVSDGFRLNAEVPLAYQTNLATALLLIGEIEGAQGVLNEIGDSHDAETSRLRAAIADWQRRLTWTQRVAMFFGGQPPTKVNLGDNPGCLVFE